MKTCLKAVAGYGAAVALCLLVLVWRFKLWRADLNVPFAYDGDALFVQMWVKGVVDNGWYLRNGYLGAPGGLEMHDWPLADSLHFLILKLIALFTSNYALALNLFYLLTYPLTTLTSLFTLRRFHLSYAPAVVVSLLFTFLPYHFMRGQGHLFLASYYLVPLAILVVLWVYLDSGLFFHWEETRQKVCWNGFGWRTLVSIGVALLLGSGGVYYAFFSSFLLLVAAVACCLYRKRTYPLGAASVLIAIIFAGVLANVAPKFLYEHRYGKNPDVTMRAPIEADIYGLRLAQLLLPVERHRLPQLEHLKAKFNLEFAPYINENCTATLGLVGSFGFLFLLGRLLVHKPRAVPGMHDALARLTLFTLLLCTVGGFGALFSLFVSPKIRGYNRVSVFIAFFSLFAVALLLEKLLRRAQTSRARLLTHGLLGLLLAVGILDMDVSAFTPPYDQLKAAFAHDENFIRRIEACLPTRSQVFQLPYVPFPETLPVHYVSCYDHFRGYLHSRTLCWSHGAMRARPTDLWQQEVAKQPLEEAVRTLAFAGFRGIYLDRGGYVDCGAKIEAELTRLLETTPLVSERENLSFFNLTDYAARLRRQYTAEEWAARREAALHLAPAPPA
jgi:phosphoglycerol transferase